MAQKIFIFRHGETHYNEKHLFTGWRDSKLSPRGIKSAKEIGKKLKNKKFQTAYRTKLSRSKDTLKHVLKYHPECKKIIEDNRMIERSYGELEGRSHKSYIKEQGTDTYKTLRHWHKIEQLFGEEKEKFIKKVGKAEYDVIHRSYDIPPPGGESIKMVEKRVQEFIKDLKKYMKKNKVNVAISAHNNSMRPFRRHFEKLNVEQMMKLENPWDGYFEYDVKL
ncbi:MAG: 2,3-bisphosphoglycerate-dependent phosphoglycerate mutase [Candidatus Woesearchaeota archaeon]|nr:2,3-bisphosphoglycerate-dependent phosphoglycerate mutase [Candidatus Woesearchaeota archaeon]